MAGELEEMVRSMQACIVAGIESSFYKNVEDVRKGLPFAGDITDEDIFYYALAILWAPSYRNARDDQQWKFPRIPFTSDMEAFNALANLGRRVARVQTLQDPEARRVDRRPTFTTALHHAIIVPTYIPDEQRIYFDAITKKYVHIKSTFWIGNITQEMWDYKVGNVQQLAAWLFKHRYNDVPKKNTIQREVTADEIEELAILANSIEDTLCLAGEIDAIYQQVSGTVAKTVDLIT